MTEHDKEIYLRALRDAEQAIRDVPYSWSAQRSMLDRACDAIDLLRRELPD